VVLVQSKLNVCPNAGDDCASYGLLLRNRSAQDALLVAVNVQGLDAQGRSFISNGQRLTVIPAGAKFVLDGDLIWGVSIQLRTIRVHIHVQRFASRGRRLPQVLHASLTPTLDGIAATVSVRNPYKRSMPTWAKVYAAFLDSQGHILAAGDQATGATIAPGESFSTQITGATMGNPPPDPSEVQSVLVTVDPCGIAAGSRACPIPGAQ
jgi:hypothetical protein